MSSNTGHKLGSTSIVIFFFFNDTATTEIYTLSLHDALPICKTQAAREAGTHYLRHRRSQGFKEDRKSTRLNSSHLVISYAVFCLKKKTIPIWLRLRFMIEKHRAPPASHSSRVSSSTRCHCAV